MLILKDVRSGKFDAKSDEGIFLGYSTRSKAYKCLNTNTNKIVESVNVNIDEFIEVHEAEPTKEPEQYKSFIYFYEGMPAKEDATNQVVNQQKVSIIAESQLVNVELHLDAELQNEENAHSNFETSTHERDVETPDRDAHSDIEAKRQSVRSRTKPILSKYVRRHHPTYQIIGDKDARPMTRNRLRSEPCFLSIKEPKT